VDPVEDETGEKVTTATLLIFWFLLEDQVFLDNIIEVLMEQTKQLINDQINKKVTIPALRNKKANGLRISMLTAYDYPTALALDGAGIDAILVGDSLGMVVLGYENTLPVTMGVMIHHCKAVARGANRALLIGDMPFLSYQISEEEAICNAGRLLQEGGMDAVKLEGGRERINTIRAVVNSGIPVMGHLGLTPQSIHLLGGFRSQGKDAIKAHKLVEDAQLLQEIGCFSIVLESIPSRLAQYVSNKLALPTIGIGAGAGCDGQVLVTHDMLGLFQRFTPKFAKKYTNFFDEMGKVFSLYRAEVEDGVFPAQEHSIDMPDPEWKKFLEIETAL
jgi:3-methyl-2-oxobutanoate hydroxymethyltransferase